MRDKKILHIAVCDKFIPPFIDFIKENFDFDQHEFLLTAGMDDDKLEVSSKVRLAKNSKLGKLKHYLLVVMKIHQADKVILHGLFDIRIVKILFFTPWLLKKCYWVMWGGDLYIYQLGDNSWQWKKNEFFRRPVIKRMGNLVSYIKGDVELARNWYKAKGEYYECLMYTSNLYKEFKVPIKQSNTTNILVGNSADPSNNHIEALERLLPYKNEDICIYVPLSYGDEEHAKKVISKGKALFTDKFKALTEFMPFEKYLEFLGSVDIAIFNHKRQQAMGNTITLLGLGKTIYMRSDTTQWEFFKEKNINILDLNRVRINKNNKNEFNQHKIKEYFSLEKLIQQYQKVFS